MNPERSDYHQPSSVEELTRQNVQTIAELERVARANHSASSRLAEPKRS